LLLAFCGAVWLWQARNPIATPAARRTFAAALTLLAVAFVSPLCAATTALFSARVLHHVLIVAVVAALLALALALALPAQRAPANPAGLPLLAATAALYLWHAPPLYAWRLPTRVSIGSCS